jgi:putative DNA primase/helicase
MLHEAAVVEQFVDAMFDHQIKVNPTDIIADGNIHRIYVDGDPKGSRNGWYVLHNDEKPAGMFGCNKRYGNDTKFTWTSTQKAAPMSADERRAYREKMIAAAKHKELEQRARHEAAAELAIRIWDAGQDCVGAEHVYLARKGIQSHGLRVGAWEKVNPNTGELSVIEKDALLVPIRDTRKKIHSLQAILPDSDNVLGRDKDYLKDGDKAGRFYSIGKPIKIDGKPVILICEGYATGASLHEATDHAVIVAFDAPNLAPVASVIRECYPDATIIIAADNDQWTLTPIVNPGVTRAREAAAAIGARVAFPPFEASDGIANSEGKMRGPTDFNDMAALRGAEAVRLVIENALIDEAIEPETETQEQSYEDETPWREVSDAGSELPKEPAPKPYDPNNDPRSDNVYFRVLGYDRDKYYIYQKQRKHIRGLTKGDLSDLGFIEMAEMTWWEDLWPGRGRDGGMDKRAAANWFFAACAAKGIYDPSMTRGRGAWMDDGRAVFHHGDVLTVDGVKTDVAAINSKFVYQKAIALRHPADVALSNEDGAHLVNLAKQFRWSKPGSAALLAGWVMLAPLCGALGWRPHIWLTGGAGCGKSTVLNDFIHPLMGGNDLFAQGSSSEAGLRQKLEHDALPVVFDESESNEEGDARRIQNILSLIRQASTQSDAKTYKGTAGGQSMSFHIQSMFCLASIQVAIKHQADIERLTVLGLRPKREDPNAAANWKALNAELYTIKRDPTMGQRLLRRGLELLPNIIQSIDVFTEVAAQRFGSQREGDQYGTLLAGAWSLVSREVVTRADAEALIDSFDWSEHRDTSDADESQKALSALMESKLIHLGTGYTVFELVHEAHGDGGGIGISAKVADAVLGRAGMRVRGDDLLLSNQSQQLKRQVEGTPYASDLRGLLLRLPGATRNDQKPIRFSGVLSKCIVVPLGPILNDVEEQL